jgi:hypothetical protein
MRLPVVNPIDSRWLPAGVPIDHEGSTHFQCLACGATTTAEHFVVILGRYGGFGAPFFAKPFMRRASTKGKVGNRSRFIQCCHCESLFPNDATAYAQLREAGLQEDAFVAADHVVDFWRNRRVHS